MRARERTTDGTGANGQAEESTRDSRGDGTRVSRRTVLRASAAGTAAVGGSALVGRGAAQDESLGDWLSGVGNFDGVVDETGAEEVTVEVGVDANGGPYGYGPAAIRVDSGTTVVWKWVAGSHNVVADDGSYESELVGAAGHTFSRTFETEGVSKYFCRPHEAMGMKGAVVVGSGGGSTTSDGGGLSSTDIGTLAFAGALVGGLLSPFATKAFGNSTDA